MKRAFALLAVAVFAIHSAGAVLADDVLFRIHGKDGSHALDVTASMLGEMDNHRFKAVLPGGTGTVQEVSGPLVRDLLKAAGLEGSKVVAKALDGYEMDIPMSDMTDFDVIAATRVDGKPLSVRDRGPAWIVYPNVDRPDLKDALYEARSVWQVKELIVE